MAKAWVGSDNALKDIRGQLPDLIMQSMRSHDQYNTTIYGLDDRYRGVDILLAFDIPAGQAAAYYPEVNPLVPLESIGDGSHTPTSKFIAIRLERARDDGRIL